MISVLVLFFFFHRLPVEAIKIDLLVGNSCASSSLDLSLQLALVTVLALDQTYSLLRNKIHVQVLCMCVFVLRECK